MLSVVRNYSKQLNYEIVSKGRVKIFKSKKNQNKIKTDEPKKVTPVKLENEYRENEMKIQMISSTLYQQIFGQAEKKILDPENIDKWIKGLIQHGIKIEDSPKIQNIDLKLPSFEGETIVEHFLNIAKDQISSYQKLIDSLLNVTNLPSPPRVWSKSTGWTKYCSVTGKPIPIDYPDDQALIFDVEVCVPYGQTPIMATAVGPNSWYSWVSRDLFESQRNEIRRYSVNDFIPLESRPDTKGFDFNAADYVPRIIVGHNVSYDRSKVKEQYWIENTATRFLDTMSLHVCVSGVTSYQRAMLKSKKEMNIEDLEWSSQTSLNSLAEVYKLYCEQELDKEKRNIFVEGSLQDVRENFDDLIQYCSNDVIATHSVLGKLFPLFQERFKHPATLCGMLEIGSAYLPINNNWERYIRESDLSYEDLNTESKYLLTKRADEMCKLLKNENYKRDLWMWDQDWSVQELSLKKSVGKVVKTEVESEEKQQVITSNENLTSDEQQELENLKNKFNHLITSTKYRLPVRRPLLPGYPAWYRKLCAKPNTADWSPGPQNVGTGMQVAPKLLHLCWEGYPLHFIRDKGWGFIVPFKSIRDPEDPDGDIPLAELVQKCPVIDSTETASKNESQEALGNLWKDVEKNLSKKDYYRKKKDLKPYHKNYSGTGVWCNVDLENCCWFFKLPHKDGATMRVGNPLAKDFLNKFSENVLSGDGMTAERVIEIARMLSYWRNNRDRIKGQMAVWLDDETALPDGLRNSDWNFGAIIPQVVVCGTLTRRAMEPTWMTASNAQRERIGSELRAMIQAPPGYKIVGADVDSQELWIASVLGDASATGCHGATPFGWMTLSGSKSSGTDMHSVTAKAVGISRDHAKVINYARIYGAGQNFAERLLKQFNPTIADGEARSKAMKMFSLTKGKKLYYLKRDFEGGEGRRGYTSYEALRLAAAYQRGVSEMFEKPKWYGGTESAMFNRLEEIAGCEKPVTPFLHSRLSRALESDGQTEDRFLPTRINWVVQSGAVDFLHLMLVCMRWLMGNKIRFCLSFHDEVRYLVREEDAYKAALAMHITNLLTRSYCAQKIGLNDLPMSIAFFTSVEVDTVLRKESQMDCKTPSNPYGLTGGYGIVPGESLDVYQAAEKAGGSDLTQWDWHCKNIQPEKKSFNKT